MTQQLIRPRDRVLRLGGAAGVVGPALFAVVFILQNVVRAAGLFVAAVFSLARGESGAVYDPGFHRVAGMMFFGGTAVGLIALSRRLARDPQWRGLSRYSLAAGLASIAGGVVMNVLAIPDDAPLHGTAGLIQRVILLVILFPILIPLGHRLRRLTA